ncbi:hypothetical protein [Streptomyces sp. H27-H5]|uniref:hypothetical protein n=1 Tax=Streptomyces sp. H27-H5 TaxID=2996460 RepID=UPI00227166DC|nr:hypothetical protein [Streptomyces sp. H27-H5]MCY0960835.1 hypothetical protein [Streptomyces sp. H27-H5]
MSTRDPSNLAARNLLAQRLVDHHGLDPIDAHTAVSRVHYGLDTEHEHLVRQEASAVLDEVSTALRTHLVKLVAALAPRLQEVGEAAARALEQITRPPRPRPAWQSPYGPARKGHRP